MMLRFVFLIVCLIAQPAHAGWFSYDNHDDCMLGRMKSQDQSMRYTADRLCKRQFGIPISVETNDVKWRFNGPKGQFMITITEIPDEVAAITEGRFYVSGEVCNAPNQKFEDITLPFLNGMMIDFDRSDVACARAISFKGRYKP
jgi:hypothetical protein